LRALIGGVLVVGMLTGWWMMSQQKFRKQAQAVGRIRSMGGRVYWDYQWSDDHPVPGGQPQQAAWLRAVLGDACFDRAIAVDLRLVESMDDVLPLIRFLPFLESIDAHDTNADDQLTQQLTRNRLLLHLNLAGTRITDAGIGHIAQLSHLRTLSLRNTSITDRGVVQLTRCTRLRELDLRQTVVTAAARNRLKGYLSQCKIFWGA